MTSCCLNNAWFTLKSLSATTFVTSFLLLSAVFERASSRARMVEPPMRSSYWRENVSREGIDAPVNVNDELLNCGGFEYQWLQRNGECGACGDGVGGVRENEYPGKYSQFLPQRTYRTTKNGKNSSDNQGVNIINVTVFISPNLLGYFIFRLCPNRDGPGMDLAECFNRNSPLVVQDINSTRYYPGSRGGFHDLHLEIPTNVSCDHCILQWSYITGYREGRADQCQACLGCGPQEQYVNCADIQILPVGATSATDEGGNKVTSTPTEVTSGSMLENPSTTTLKPSVTTTATTQAPPTRATATPGPGVNPVPCTPSADIVTCEARGLQRLMPDIDTWCLRTCKSGHCQAEFCDCFCKYPSYRISIDHTAFDLKTAPTVPQPSPPSTSSSTKYHCYKPIPLWSRALGLNNWCASNCPSKLCADMCSLQICP